MMLATVASRLLGWARDRSIGHYFGSTPHTDAYWAAFGVPDLLYYLLAGGALSAALIPVMTGYLVRGEDEQGWRVVNTLATLLVVLVAVGVAVIMAFAPYLVWVTAPGFRAHPAQFAECVLYTRVMAAMVFFTALSALSSGVLQSFRHFTAPSLAWLVYNVGIIFGIIVLSPSLGIVGMCLGVLLGAAAMVAVQVPALVRRGYRFRPNLDLRQEGVRTVGRLFFPVMAGLALTQIGLLWLPGFFGSFFAEGVTNLRYANRLVILPLGMFAVAISTAAFPALAAQVAEGRTEQFRRTLADSLRAILVLAMPSAVVLAVLAEPLLRLLWQSGQFGDRALQAASFALVFYSAGLVGLSLLQVINRGFYSLRDMVTPLKVGFLYVTLNVLVVVALMRTPLQYGAVALGLTVSVTAGCLVLLGLLSRRLGGVHGRELLAAFARILVASAALGATAWVVSAALGHALGVPTTHFRLAAPTGGAAGPSAVSRLHVLIQAGGALAAGGLAYLAALWALRAPELATVMGAMRSRMKRRGA